MKTTLITTPKTHAEANGHWDRAAVTSPDDRYLLLDIQFQNGPIEVHGINGVQLPTVLRLCLARYQMLNKSFPCRENSLVITNLQQAIMWDEERTAQRTALGVEGTDAPRPTAVAGPATDVAPADPGSCTVCGNAFGPRHVPIPDGDGGQRHAKGALACLA
jgi:hypothetical protein